jgi:hypothetical protein
MMCDAKVPLWLLCLAAGYGVLVVANRQERPLDKLGRLFGGLILLLSCLGLVMAAVCKIQCIRSGGCDAMGGRPGRCVFSGQSSGLLGSADNPAPSNDNAVATPTPSSNQ